VNCDDQIWLVKRENDPYADALKLTRVTRLSPPISIKRGWFPDDPLNFLDGCLQASKAVLRMS
jgi:hypothetical protein